MSEPQADDELTVTVRNGPGSAARTYLLRCDPPAGDHPEPAAACAAIERAARPFAPVPKDQQCTEIYGGPQTASVRGRWRGVSVDATFSRTNGCEIARWDALAPVFGARAGRTGAT